jgi:two-component system phosphate regulon sensor histidine kinase PhoR
MTHHGWSLRWLIGGIYFIIMVLILGGLALFFSYRVEADIVSSDLGVLQKVARSNAEWLAEIFTDLENHRLDAGTLILVNKGLQRKLFNIYMETQADRVAILRMDGTVMPLPTSTAGFEVAEAPYPTTINPTASSLFDREIMAARNGDLGWDFRENPETGERFLYIAAPIRIKERIGRLTANHWVPKAILLLAVPHENLRQAEVIASVRAAGVAAVFATLVIVLLVTVLVSSYIAQPLAGLSAAAARYADGQLDERVAPTGPAEVVSLGESFNEMAEQLRLTITKLAEERAQAQAILTSMADALLVTDEDGRILLVNRAAEQLCGLTAADAVGRALEETIPHGDLRELLGKVLNTRIPLKHEIILATPTERHIEVHLAPVLVEDYPQGVVLALYDMTQERKVAQMHRDFVANVSHELRTPVTSIRATAEAILEAGIDDPQTAHDFMETIAAESERLTGLLDDLLNLSRIETGHRHLTLEELDVREIIQYVVTRVITPITAKGQRLELDVPASLPVMADRDALVQIVVNLLENACKYSPEGASIRVRAAADAHELVLAVSDTGIGISPEEQERVFERFYRVDKARSRAQGGTGLGLAIVRHLVELHGGRITVISDPGVGSTFTVVLPQAGDAAPADAGERPSGKGVPAP